MSDSKLRELARRWKQSDAAEDEAVYLLEQVRVGAISRSHLELAAYCGHIGAILAVGGERPELARVEILCRFGRSIAVRAAVAALSAVPDLSPPTRALYRALRAWCDDPGPPTLESVDRAKGQLADASTDPSARAAAAAARLLSAPALEPSLRRCLVWAVRASDDRRVRDALECLLRPPTPGLLGLRGDSRLEDTEVRDCNFRRPVSNGDEELKSQV